MINCVLKFFRLWQEVGFIVLELLCSVFLDDVVYDVEIIRKVVVLVLVVVINEYLDVVLVIFQQLVDFYDVKFKVRFVKG